MSRGIETEYISKLIPTFSISNELHKSWIIPSSISSSTSLSACPVEPLSERELQVLRLLDSSLTSTEIGRELFLSQNTVRTHIRNIYSKLAVHGRIEAIQKAKAADLI
jgi:LuxR family maltose regulon positive regulatory protein